MGPVGPVPPHAVASCSRFAGWRQLQAGGGSGGGVVALGVWAAVSAAWERRTRAGWTTLDQLLIRASALVVGGMVATSAARIRVIQYGVLAGIAAHGIELLARLALSSDAPSYFHGRVLYGLVGCKTRRRRSSRSVSTTALALAAHHRRLPHGRPEQVQPGAALRRHLADRVARRPARARPQVLVQIVWSRNLRVAATALVTLAASAALFPQLRHVDRALFTASRHTRCACTWCSRSRPPRPVC